MSSYISEIKCTSGLTTTPLFRIKISQIAVELEEAKVNLRVLDQSIDTSDATGRLLFNMLGAIAQFETELRSESQMDGILRAKERGVQFGQKHKLSSEQIVEMQQKREDGVLIKELMAEYKLSKASVYRYLGRDISAEIDKK